MPAFAFLVVAVAAASLAGCLGGPLGGLDVVEDPEDASFARCVQASGAGSFTNAQGSVKKVTFANLPEGYTVRWDGDTCEILPPQ